MCYLMTKKVAGEYVVFCLVSRNNIDYNRSLTHSLTHSLTKPNHSLTDSLTHSLTHSLTEPNHSLTDSLTHSLTDSLINSFIGSLTHSPNVWKFKS